MKKGIATIVTVIIVMMISLFVILTWESRFLLAIQRYQSLVDVIAASYAAESEIYDWVAKFLGNYPGAVFPSGPPIEKPPLADGTRLILTGSHDVVTNDDMLLITAIRQFATTNLQFTRNVNTGDSTNYTKVEIVIGFDCSVSMVDDHKITVAQTALMNFLTEINKSSDRSIYHIGIIPFRTGAQWWYAVPGEKTTNNITTMLNLLSARTWDYLNDSPLCKILGIDPNITGHDAAQTNLGAPTFVADDYFVKNPLTKQAYILFTDGLPNTSPADGGINCGGIYACSNTENAGGSSSCRVPAINFLKCTLGKDNDQWNGINLGKRPQQVDTYAVTVATEPSNANAKLTYLSTVDVFKDSKYINTPYFVDNLNDLPQKFLDILHQIQSSIVSFTLKRVIPSP